MAEERPPVGGSYLLSESVIDLAEAARRSETHVSVVYRWLHQGLRGGIRLEGCLRGSRWVTSAEALNRFFDRLTAARRGESIGAEAPPARTEARRRLDSEEAGKLCEQLGA